MAVLSDEEIPDIVPAITVQNEAILEGRYRKPLDPLFVAASVIMLYRWRTRRPIPAA